MARQRPVRDALLAEAKAQRRREGNKLSRLRQAGVDVSSLDRRMSNAELATLSPRQLRAQIARGQAFVNRSNGYVPGLNGAPLSASTVREYRAAERARNEASARFYDSVRNLPVPGLGQTVEERLGNLSRSKSAFGDYFSFALPNKQGVYPERNVGNVVGQAELKDLLAQKLRQNDPRYLEREARLTRQILGKILAKTGLDDLIPDIKKLSDEDLIAMTQYMGFTNTAEGRYALSKSTSTDRPAWQSAVYEDSEDILREQLEAMINRTKQPEPQDTGTDDTRSTTLRPGRDKYGRFVAKNRDNPEPNFNRDAGGRFARKIR